MGEPSTAHRRVAALIGAKLACGTRNLYAATARVQSAKSVDGSSRHDFPRREKPNLWSSAASLYAGELLEAQVRFARAAGERLREHPGVRAWDIGHEFSNVRELPHAKVSSGEHSKEPAAEREVAAWSRRLAETLNDCRRSDAMTHQVHLTYA